MNGLLYDPDYRAPAARPIRSRALDGILMPEPETEGVAPWSGLPPTPGYTEARVAAPLRANTWEGMIGQTRDALRGTPGASGYEAESPVTRMVIDNSAGPAGAWGGIIGGVRGVARGGSPLLDRLNRNLPVARSRAPEGVTTDLALWQETGWQRFPDGSWRMEIPDAPSRLTPTAQQAFATGQRVEEIPLRDVLQHDELYRAYPPQGDIPVTLNGNTGGLIAYYEQNANLPGGGRIVIGPQAAGDAHSILLHEVNHGIQRVEDHAPGTNQASNEVQHRMGVAAAIRQEEKNRIIAARNAFFAQRRLEQPNISSTRLFEEWENAFRQDARRAAELHEAAMNPPTPFRYYEAALGEVEARAVQGRFADPYQTQFSPLDTMRDGYGALPAWWENNGPSLSAMDWWDPRNPRLRIRSANGLLVE